VQKVVPTELDSGERVVSEKVRTPVPSRSAGSASDARRARCTPPSPSRRN